MTGDQLTQVLVVGAICVAVVLFHAATAWADRARHRAAEARELRLAREVALEQSRERRYLTASTPTDDLPTDDRGEDR